eukprot:4894930-Prymnesium_polylepis.1
MRLPATDLALQEPGQATAPAAASAPAVAQMELTGHAEQPTGAEPRGAAAAAPHKRQAERPLWSDRWSWRESGGGRRG